MEAIAQCAKQPRTPFAVIIWGPTDAIYNTDFCAQMAQLGQPDGPLGAFHPRLLYAFLSKDELLADRQPGELEVTRSVLLRSNRPFKPGLNHMSSLIPWTPVMLVHILGMLGLSRTLPQFHQGMLRIIFVTFHWRGVRFMLTMPKLSCVFENVCWIDRLHPMREAASGPRRIPPPATT